MSADWPLTAQATNTTKASSSTSQHASSSSKDETHLMASASKAASVHSTNSGAVRTRGNVHKVYSHGLKEYKQPLDWLPNNQMFDGLRRCIEWAEERKERRRKGKEPATGAALKPQQY